MVELDKPDLSHPHGRRVDFTSCTSMASFKQATARKRTTTHLFAESKGKQFHQNTLNNVQTIFIKFFFFVTKIVVTYYGM